MLILLDTMEILQILVSPSHTILKEGIDKGTIKTIASAITLTEIYKIIGKKSEEEAKKIVREIMVSNIEIKPADYRVCVKAGEIRLHYDIPTADALIAATGMVNNASHILTTDQHFQSIKKLIKPISIKELKKIGKLTKL